MGATVESLALVTAAIAQPFELALALDPSAVTVSRRDSPRDRIAAAIAESATD
jgi:hypothetical protein